MLFEGERIKIYPETNVKAYKDWIYEQGFLCSVGNDYIKVGRRFKRGKLNAAAFGRMISSYRKTKGWTRFKVCKMINVHEDTLLGWELGLRTPKPENLDKLVKVLNISQEDLEKCRT